MNWENQVYKVCGPAKSGALSYGSAAYDVNIRIEITRGCILTQQWVNIVTAPGFSGAYGRFCEIYL